VVANRSWERARRLAATAGGTAVPLALVAEAISDSDVVVSCTGATGLVISRDHLAPRTTGRLLTIVDLALPHDVDPSVADLPTVSLIALNDLADRLHGVSGVDVDAVRRIVASEVTAFASARRAAQVTPTVVALRGLATDVVETELQRLVSRLPGLDPLVRAEVEQTMRRVADKLLHAPTVRVKELADHPDGISYTDALAKLFSLDPEAVNAVTRPDPQEGE
jgi:glutamyl-tRNA reductase